MEYKAFPLKNMSCKSVSGYQSRPICIIYYEIKVLKLVSKTGEHFRKDSKCHVDRAEQFTSFIMK